MASRKKQAVPTQTLEEPDVVNAFPTKELFIYMLVRDITLIPAIKDLVDNSVDGARRIKPAGKFLGLWVRVEFDGKQFKIADNCGGMNNDVARKYAFRFGRPEEAGQQKHSIGQFGVGMKRSLFKMGSNFTVSSTAERSRFDLEVDVNEWKKDPKKWQFVLQIMKTTSVKQRLNVAPRSSSQNSILASQKNFKPMLSRPTSLPSSKTLTAKRSILAWRLPSTAFRSRLGLSHCLIAKISSRRS